MDNEYWLAKAVRQQNATLQLMVNMFEARARAGAGSLSFSAVSELQAGLDKATACLDHVDTHVERG